MQGNVNIPDSTITTNLSFRNLVLMNMQQLTNFPYIENDFDALTDYELLSLVVKFLNDVIANQNEQNASITRMYQSFLALQTYVNNTKDTLEDAFNELDDYVRNYFDNLDVQDEINNKLDEMLEDGVLEQIIEQFLQSTAIWSFDTVNDMKAATNLISGSTARTLGYYAINDGGGAEYYITNTVNSSEHQETLNSGLYATLIINETYPNVRKFGIHETESGDISNTIQSIITLLNNKNVIPYISLLNIDTTLEIPMSAKIKIDRLNYTGNDYAISLSQGINGNIQIEFVYSLTGSGIHINPTGEYSGNGYYQFNKIAVNGHSVYFDNDSTIVNSTFEGVQWYSRVANCFVIKPKTSAVIGQCNFRVNNYYALDNIGIVIDTTNGSLTNLDFGYSSVEGSTNGILVNLVNFTEGIKGYFRVNEVGSHANNQYVLKIKGAAQQIRNQFDITFDSYRYDKIDLSELTMNLQSSRANPNILIQGKCFNGVGDVVGYSGRIMNNRLCMDYVNATIPYNLTATIELNYETSNSTPRISSNFTTGSISDNIFVTLPKSLKPGVISSLINNSGHNVTIKPYGNPSSTGILFSSSGFFTTMIDGNGNCQVIKL